MKMVGHKTESIYQRYAIVDEAMLKEGASKLQILHDAQAPMAPVIQLTDAPGTKRLGPSTGRVSRAQRARRAHAARAKSLQAGEKTMVGWDGIEPPTPGFSDQWARAMPFTSRAVQRPRISWPVFPLPAGWTAVEIQDNKQVTLLRPTASSRDSIGFKAKTRAGARGRESARATPVHRACYKNYLPRTMGLSMGPRRQARHQSPAADLCG
jgi:hypothetical protein